MSALIGQDMNGNAQLDIVSIAIKKCLRVRGIIVRMIVSINTTKINIEKDTHLLNVYVKFAGINLKYLIKDIYIVQRNAIIKPDGY